MANTKGEKELKTSYDELSASDSTKYIGHKQTLEPENTIINKKDKVGI